MLQEGKANNAYQTLDREKENVTLLLLTHGINGYSNPLQPRMAPITRGRMSPRQLLNI